MIAAGPVVSVRPQPSRMGVPSARKNAPVCGFRGAPPLTKNFTRPPNLALILSSTSLSASARWAAQSGPGDLPAFWRAAARSPTSTAQSNQARLRGSSLAASARARSWMLSKTRGTFTMTVGRASAMLSISLKTLSL